MKTRTIAATASIAALSSLLISAALDARAPDRGCAHATVVVAKGYPRAGEEHELAFHTLRSCGVAGANAVAAGARRYATESNIDVLESFMREVDIWRDAAVLDMMMELATNASATPQARVFAVRHMLNHLHPYHRFSYARLVASADTTLLSDGILAWSTSACSADYIASHRLGSATGTPPASDAVDRIRATLASLANSAATPKPVRNAAGCLIP